MTAYFEATTECFGDFTCFTSAYPFSSPNANSWYWDFDDGNTSTLQNPCHQYNAPGNYSVTLTVWDNTYADSSYCINSFTDTTVHVRELPIADFSADTACFLDATQFTDLSLAVEPGSTLLSTRAWYFDGDNLIDATSVNPPNIFDTCGLNIYDVTLGVYDNNGCYNDTTKSITISCPPIAEFTIDSACIGTCTYFESTSDIGTFPIISYQWYNAGGSDCTQNGNNYYANYEFNNIGLQASTQLTISDPYGCSDSIVHYAYVRDKPHANFYTFETNYCEDFPIQFFENSFTTGFIDSIYWEFTGGLTSNGTDTITNTSNPIVSFIDDGNYPITLFVVDEYGCFDDTLYTIEIDNLPIVDFEWDDDLGQACADTLVCFNSLSTQSIDGNPLDSYIWDFGDGSASDPIPCHFFSSVDPFAGACDTVILTVTDILGCSNSKEYIITIHPIPEVIFKVDSGICQGDCYILQDFTQFNFDACISDVYDKRVWTFNGNQNGINPFDSTGYCPDALLPTSIMHNFNLEVFTNWGCSNEANIEVEYWQNPEITYSIGYPNDTCGSSIPFNFTSSILYTDSMSVSINDPIHSNAFPNSPWINTTSFSDITPHEGIFDVEIYLQNFNNKCTVIENDVIKAYPLPRAIYDTTDLIFCYNEDTLINFIDLSDIPNGDIFEEHDPTGTITTEIDNWRWNINSIFWSNNPIDSHLFVALNDAPTIYNIELIVETNYGCQDTTNSTVTVLPTPIADFEADPLIAPNYGKYLLNGKSSTTSLGTGNPADPNLYHYSWIIYDGPVDTVGIFDGVGPDLKNYFPSPDSLLYQFYSFVYGEDESTEICLEVISKLNIPLGLTKECKDIICKNIKIEAWAELFIPNALYPASGDEGYSLFLPKGKSLTEYELQIFDKFGNLLWLNNEINLIDGSPKVGWDGTSNGTLLPQGIYIWKIDASFKNGPWQGVGSENKKTGVVYLIR